MKTIHIILFIFFLIISYTASYSQKEFNNWYFGDYAGITFNTSDGVPVALTDGAMEAGEGSSTISDKDGNLLFYTNGEKVWNRDHKIMANGDSLMGGRSAVQAAIIVPKPGSNYIYYIFTIEDFWGENGYRYSVVDMRRNNNLGEIIKKNIFLYNPSDIKRTLESLTAVKHRNGRDIWVITHEVNTNIFRNYLVTNSGVSSEPVFCGVGRKYGPSSLSFKLSPDGGKLAMRINRGFELFDFDNSTGVLSNSIEIRKIYGPLYTIEFSPDGNLLYGGCYQYNLLAGDADDIINTRELISHSDTCYPFVGIQKGPDNKIYVIHSNIDKYFLGVINNPNISGKGCNYIRKAIDLEGRYSVWGLPAFVQGDYSYDVSAYSNSPICEGDTLYLYASLAEGIIADAFNWTGPLNFHSTEQNPVIPDARYEASGYYKLTVSSGTATFVDSVLVEINSVRDLSILTDGSATFCKGGSVVLSANEEYAAYEWSTGETSAKIEVRQKGAYSVVVTDSNGCTGAAEIEITVYEKPVILITGDNPFCKGDSVILSIKNEYAGYVWSTGDTTSSIVVKQVGYFSVSVTDSNGCTCESEEITIRTYPSPRPEISGPNSVCENSEAQYSIESLPNTTIDWNVTGGNITAGDGAETITVGWNAAGIGFVEVIQKYKSSGCSGSDTLEILIADSLKPDISLSNPVLCEGGSVTLSAPEGYASYKWNSGVTTREIIVTEAGIYYVKVTDAEGCAGTSAPVEIIEAPNPVPVITGNRRFCEGDSLNLDLLDYDDYNDILWSTDEKTKRIIVTQPGEYWVEATDANGCMGTAYANIELIEIVLSGLEDIPFGSVLIFNEAQNSLNVSNAGEDAVKIESVNMKGIEGEAFTVETTPEIPLTLQSGESIAITIKFKPDAARGFLDSLIIEISEPCVETRSTACAGAGYELNIGSTVRLPELTGEIGVPDFRIPIYAKLDSDTILTNLSYTAEISFDAKLFLPEGVSKGNISGSGIAGGERTLVINGFEESLGAEEKILTEIFGLVLLGDNDETPLRFDDFSFSNSMPVNKTHGILKVKGVCVKNLRSIRSFSPTNMTITPNPAGNKINIRVESEEEGSLAIAIYTIQGVKIKSFNLINNQKKDHNIIIDVNDFSEGLYQIVLKSPKRIISKLFIILK